MLPAMTEAIWPATFAPTACMSKWFCGSASWPSFCTTLADMGKAEIPAAPTIGFIFFFKNRFKSLANITPPTVSNTKANRPRLIISSVTGVKKSSAFMLNAIVMPSSRVMRFESTLLAVSERLLSTPHSLIRLPNIKKPTSAMDAGAITRDQGHHNGKGFS